MGLVEYNKNQHKHIALYYIKKYYQTIIDTEKEFAKRGPISSTLVLQNDPNLYLENSNFVFYEEDNEMVACISWILYKNPYFLPVNKVARMILIASSNNRPDLESKLEKELEINLYNKYNIEYITTMTIETCFYEKNKIFEGLCKLSKYAHTLAPLTSINKYEPKHKVELVKSEKNYEALTARYVENLLEYFKTIGIDASNNQEWINTWTHPPVLIHDKDLNYGIYDNKIDSTINTVVLYYKQMDENVLDFLAEYHKHYGSKKIFIPMISEYLDILSPIYTLRGNMLFARTNRNVYE